MVPLQGWIVSAVVNGWAAIEQVRSVVHVTRDGPVLVGSCCVAVEAREVELDVDVAIAVEVQGEVSGEDGVVAAELAAVGDPVPVRVGHVDCVGPAVSVCVRVHACVQRIGVGRVVGAVSVVVGVGVVAGSVAVGVHPLIGVQRGEVVVVVDAVSVVVVVLDVIAQAVSVGVRRLVGRVERVAPALHLGCVRPYRGGSDLDNFCFQTGTTVAPGVAERDRVRARGGVCPFVTRV